MATPRHLTRAPITEALIDFRVRGTALTGVDALEDRIAGGDLGYYRKSPILRGTFGFALNPSASPQASNLQANTRTVGVRYHSRDERYVAQFSLDGCTLSRLTPYESWELLVQEARRIWEFYRAKVEPREVGRVATRFINNLHLPVTSGDRLQRYLTHWPPFWPELPQQVEGFLQRFSIRDPISHATIILTQGLDDTTSESPLPVMLDIDVFRTATFRCDDNGMWDMLTTMRDVKNRFFFSALSDEAIRLYE